MVAVELDKNLNDFNPTVRLQAVIFLAEQIKSGNLNVEKEKMAFNMHCHTFFSFNACGYSPSSLACLAKINGYTALGIVDFDTLDGVNEFLDACEILNVRGSAGIETRIFIPEFSTREINSPGEPGVSYHMGIGFTSSSIPDSIAEKFALLRQRSDHRNREMISLINQYLNPVTVDYDLDVIPLTPSGNVTERHILSAYIHTVEERISDKVSFWAKTLGQSSEQIRKIIDIPDKFPNLIRSKLMKRGGVGYIQPAPTTFPTIEEFHTIITTCGALPCFAWLDGTSSGEQDINELLELVVLKGVVAVNIIPDRNWNISDPDLRNVKVQKLYDFVKKAQDLDLPINVGTEMNSPGNKLVDDFYVPELLPLYPVFWDGACFIYGHTVLQRTKGLGYFSSWAQRNLPTRRERNSFFTKVGQLTPPGKQGLSYINQLEDKSLPQDFIIELEKMRS